MNCGRPSETGESLPSLPLLLSLSLSPLSDKLISLPAAGAADVLCRQRNPVIMLVIIISSMSLPSEWTERIHR